jgi:hypothetical protein
MRRLTERQSRFIQAYLQGPVEDRYNATRAARAAGYAFPEKQGWRLMKVPRVAIQIELGFQVHLAHACGGIDLELICCNCGAKVLVHPESPVGKDVILGT